MNLPILLVVLGTRPEAIKLGTVIPALRVQTGFRTVVLWTGQHPLDELGAVARTFGIEPDVILPPGAMARGEWTLRPEDEPDAVLVQGDTRSTEFGAKIAETLGAKLIHLEAGLRCWDGSLPEERIRVAVDEAADLLLCPTVAARLNAIVSAKSGAEVRWVGQTGIDGLLHVRGVESDDERVTAASAAMADLIGPLGNNLRVLVTLHRAARTESHHGLRTFAAALGTLQDFDVLWPVHPRIREAAKVDPEIREALDIAAKSGVRLCAPIPYEVLAQTIESTFDAVITDSGGLVEECAVLGIPCVIARPNTERTEVVGAGRAVLCPQDGRIPQALDAALICPPMGDFDEYGMPGEPTRLTVEAIVEFFDDLRSFPEPEPKDDADA